MRTLKKMSVAVLVAAALCAAAPAAQASTSQDDRPPADGIVDGFPLVGGVMSRGVDLNEIVYGLGLHGLLGTPPK